MDFSQLFRSGEFDFDSSKLLEHLTLEQVSELLDLMRVKNFKKGDVLLREGEIENEFYLVREGIVIATFEDGEGRKFNRSIFTENSLFATPMIFKNKPSKIAHTCLTDVTAAVGNFNSFIQLTKKYHQVALFFNKILQEVFILFEDKIMNQGTLDARERYLQLLKDDPKIESLISQKQIAFFLGISPVQLSRIKSKLLMIKK